MSSASKPKQHTPGFKSLISSAFKRGNKTPAVENEKESNPKNSSHMLNSLSPAKRLFSPGSTRKASRLKEIQPSYTETPRTKTELIPAHQPEDDNNIKVVVRIRPRSAREQNLGGAICVSATGNSTVHVAANPSYPESHSFSFDHVAPEPTSQQDIFDLAGQPVVANCLKGFNGCLLAYGQTGSGKTHTMLGSDDVSQDNEGRGVIIRVFEQLFAALEVEAIQSGDAAYSATIRCSFLEIFNETVNDLLNGASNLALREDSRKGVYVEGLAEYQVMSIDDVLQLLQSGVANRHVGDTQMNERSSRSHSVFTASVERRIPASTSGQPAKVLKSRLHLVDLAGSERQKATGAEKERLKEASGINKSLSTLGHVIMSLVDKQNGKTRHVPYRDSRLTFLLQDSLGGNAKTVLVATVSPAAVNTAETISTLRFADSAKRIKNKAVVNEDADGDAESLKREIKRLKEELESLKHSGAHQQDDLPDTIPIGDEGTRRALIGALRREEAASLQASDLSDEIEKMKELLVAKESDLQRTAMMLKLKESRLARASHANNSFMKPDDAMQDLQSEIELLKSKIDSHPEVKRFAVENLHLAAEVARLKAVVDHGELAALQQDVAGLRRELLSAAAVAEAAREDAALHMGEAEAAKAALAEGKLQIEAAESNQAASKADSDAVERLQVALKENDELRITAGEAKKTQQQYEALCTHAAGFESDKEKWQLTAERAQHDLDELDRAYLGTLEELGAAWEESAALEDEAAALQQQLVCKETQIEMLKAQYDAERAKAAARLAAAVEAQEETQKALGSKSKELQTLEVELTEQLTTVTATLDTTRTALSEVEARCCSLTELQSQTASNLKQTELKLQTTVADLEQTQTALAAIETEAAKLKIDLDAKAELLATTKSSLEDCNSSVKRLEAELSEAVAAKDTSASECDALRSRLNDALATTAEKEALINDYEKQTNSLQASIDDITSKHNEAVKALHEKEAALETMTQQHDDVESELNLAKAAVDEAEGNVEKLTKKLKFVVSAEEELRKEVGGLRFQLAGANEALEMAQSQVEALKGGPLEKEQQLLLVKSELEDLKKRESKAKQEIQLLRAAVEGRDAEMKKLRSELQSEVSEAAQQVQLLLAAQGRAEEAERRQNRLEEKLNNEIAEKAALVQELAKERQCLADVTGNNNANQRIKLHTKIKAENDELRQDAADAKAEAARYADKCRSIEEELHRVKTQAFRATH